jgi:hypothetical protein
MALTELQLPTKSDLYNTLQNIAGEISSAKHRWSLVATFINRMTTTDLDAVGVAAGQVRIDLVDLKNLLNEIVSLLNNNPVTPAKDPQEVVDKCRKISHG